MAALAYSTSSLLGFGLVDRKVTVVNVPRGSTVARIRSRQDEFIRVYLRTPHGFEEWFVDFADASHRTLKLTHLIGQNIRPSPSSLSPLARSA